MISSINIKCIHSSLHLLIDYLSDVNHDFISITETWLTDNDPNQITKLKELGYSFYHSPRSIQKRGGGICVIYNSDYVINNVVNYSLYYSECLIISFRLHT